MSRLLEQLHPLATVGVGSLPFIDPAVAVRHAVRAYDVPFCPQLPALDGDMIGEWLGADPARCGWTPDRDRPEPRSWPAFVQRVTERPPTHGIVKLQVTGPLTLAAGLEHATGGAASTRGTLALAAEIATWLAANAAAQVRQLCAAGVQTLLIVDEPGLAHLGASPEHAAAWDPLRAVAPAWGLHVCGQVPWSLVELLEPDVVSYDLVRYGLDQDAAAVLGRLVRGGTRSAFGVIDPTVPESAVSAARRMHASLVALARTTGRSVPELAATTMLSPTCGTGRMSGQREHLIAAELGAAALLLRDLIESPNATGLLRDGPHRTA